MVSSLASHVQIDQNALIVQAGMLKDKYLSSNNAGNGSVEWDASGWHYCQDAPDCGPVTAQYVFVLDALNFCFWKVPGFEYDNLAVSLKKVLDADASAFDADRLMGISEVCSVN